MSYGEVCFLMISKFARLIAAVKVALLKSPQSKKVSQLTRSRGGGRDEPVLNLCLETMVLVVALESVGSKHPPVDGLVEWGRASDGQGRDVGVIGGVVEEGGGEALTLDTSTHAVLWGLEAIVAKDLQHVARIDRQSAPDRLDRYPRAILVLLPRARVDL